MPTFKGAQDEIFQYTDLIIANGEKEIAAAYASAYRNVDKMLKELYLTIQDAGIPPAEYYNYMTQYKRLERMREQIIKEYEVAFNRSKDITIKNNLTAIKESFYRNNYLLQWVKDSDQLFVVLNDSIVQEAVYGTADKWGNILEETYKRNNYTPQGGTLIETLRKNKIDDLTRIQRTLTQQFIQGTSYTKTARSFRDLFGGLSYNSERVARTEGTRVMNAGAMASTESARAQGVNIVREWLDTGDAVTRPTHVEASGQKEDKDGLFHVGGATGPYPGNMSSAAESINCRCTTIDIVDGVEPELRRATNPRTGDSEIIGFRDFPKYMEENGMKLTSKGWEKA